MYNSFGLLFSVKTHNLWPAMVHDSAFHAMQDHVYLGLCAALKWPSRLTLEPKMPMMLQLSSEEL